MRMKFAPLLVTTALLALSGCAANSDWGRELGASVDTGSFGNATMNNAMIQSGELSYAIALAERFNAEVPDTINFAFNSAELTPEAKEVLRRQAHWIRQFPEVRFRVFGHTDLVGSAGYNQRLGLRRANAAVAFLVQNGISKSRLEAVVSFGKTQPLIQTQGPEVRNRRTVTEVSGFVGRHPTVMNGKYAQVVFREYIALGARPHPGNTQIETSVAPSGG
jgi:peptidoglycan-associated lipoprotein